MKSFEFSGKNIEKAIENGLKELNKNREDVEIKILSEGGLFSKAKVEISFDENEEIIENIVKKEMNADCGCGNENCHCGDDCHCDEDCDCGCHECGDENSCDCGCENHVSEENHDKNSNHCDCEDNCDCDDDCPEKCKDCTDECGFCDCALENNCECVDLDLIRAEKEAKEKAEKENAQNQNVENIEEKGKKAREYMSSDEVFDEINKIFNTIFEKLNINGKVMILENDEAYEVKVSGDDKISSLIGYRGEALNAYQVLINSFQTLKNKSKRILLDVESYRSKREESLRSLAIRIAKKVVKTKKSHKFEPMSSFERHVIHEALSSFDGVSTHSEGQEPHRCLIVEPKK